MTPPNPQSRYGSYLYTGICFRGTGVLKNALDWTVSSDDFGNKPVAVITASTSGEKAHESLLLTFTALGGRIVKNGSLLISFIRSKMDEKGEVSDDATLQSLQSLLAPLIETINRQLQD